jgi:hypothetical protein
MATIAIQEGKVVLKDGKVSCECCGCNGPTETGVNIFQITKEEYDNYYKGGTWNISGNIKVSESAADGRSATSNSSGNFTVESSGCNFEHYETFDNNVTYQYPESEPFVSTFQQPYGIKYSLGKSEGNYYIYLCGGVSLNEAPVECADEGGTGYGTPTAKIDGNNIQLISTWTPGWSGEPGYVNTTTSNLIATFTPNP